MAQHGAEEGDESRARLDKRGRGRRNGGRCFEGGGGMGVHQASGRDGSRWATVTGMGVAQVGAAGWAAADRWVQH
jgi:hypothetical protein